MHPRVAVWVVKLIVVLAEAVAGPATTGKRIILPGSMQVATIRDCGVCRHSTGCAVFPCLPTLLF